MRNELTPTATYPSWWGIEWCSINRLDGETRYVIWHDGRPLLFRTRRKARDWVREHYAYIRQRPDLRAEPHGWRVPQAVRVTVDIKVEAQDG